ncbi:hypothetical protein [Polyangium mundeleinium]|uniref:Lipoprotein n=1 Tax=Polyangium mundeleinium TaxID=2995306 RepID=A0ABT5F5J8_9BACT|nr:hypothetical protein [Polyangium mundeleinium]MDC0749374.1 hypothetical protein [Polyangium mundeleinium]
MNGVRMVAACLTAFLLAGCGADGGEKEQTQEEDLAEFEAMREELEGRRDVFIETPAQDFLATGNTLYWVEVNGANPRLRSFDDSKKQRTDYTFKPYLTGVSSPNPVDNINFAASSTMVASMNELDGANTYAAGSPEMPRGKLVLPAPAFGQKWWAYSVTGDDLYVTVINNDSGKFVLQKWTPGQANPTDVLVLDDLIAPNVMGEFTNFAVNGTTLMFSEGGRLWLAELNDAKAKWVQNDKRVGGADFYSGGAVYSQDREFFRYDKATDTRENITGKIKASYTMNKTFAEAHHPGHDMTWCKFKDKIVYEGNFGLFAYDIENETTTPLLLDARDNSVVYKYPVAVGTGTLFVKGLESQSGATGADGPMFSLAAANLL